MNSLTEQMGMCSTNDSSNTFSLCSWNVNRLSENNYEKLVAVAETIKNLDCDIVALQEVATATAGREIAAYLNTTAPNKWSASSCQVSPENNKLIEHSVFLWKNSFIVYMGDPAVPTYYFYRKVHYFEFTYKGQSMKIANLHFRARSSLETKLLNDREQNYLFNLFQNECGCEYFFAVGDFNRYPISCDIWGQVKTNYCQLLGPQKYTNYLQNECYDNVLVPPHIAMRHKLESAVYNGNMEYTHVDATRKKISDHRPIGVVFYAQYMHFMLLPPRLPWNYHPSYYVSRM